MPRTNSLKEYGLSRNLSHSKVVYATSIAGISRATPPIVSKSRIKCVLI
jgi:hypothetical protein